MKSPVAAIARFAADEEAATAAEYGIIAALIGTFLIGGLQVFGPALQGLFSQLANKVTLKN